MLYSPEWHEPLFDGGWEEGGVRAALRAIAADAEETFEPARLWPAEESDLPDERVPPVKAAREIDGPPGLAALYAGAAGVAYGLHVLRRRGHHDGRLDLPAVAGWSLEAWRLQPDFPLREEPPVRTAASLYYGETGPLLVAWRLRPEAALADALHARVRENARTETNELMAGAPGTMLAARAMFEWTGEPRWAEAWREAAEELWRRRDPGGLWTYPPYGRGLGAAHGVVTNARVLLGGAELLPPSWAPALERETGEALARTAVLEDGLANWPMVEGEDLVGWDGRIRLQWCHGAAGIVAHAADYLDEPLLLMAAELVWRAGPPAAEQKGPGLCHGTAGNGYALLKTFERTGDERWLERARSFATHALRQVAHLRALRGRGHYSLWTGDLGAALFAADCLVAGERRARVPVVDGWED